MEPVFAALADGSWAPSEYARGPFAGLQGGAVAGLLVSELEHEAERAELGHALSTAVQFLRPAPLAPLTTAVGVLRSGRRVSVLRGELRHDGSLLAVATVTFVQPIEVPDVREVADLVYDLDGFPVAPPRPAPHGGRWFMDTLDVREGTDGIRWFGIQRPVVAALTPMAKVLGPADWTHGIARPLEPKLADPNIDLIVQLTRPPDGDWIGVRPSARWARTGVGRGAGVLHDRLGEIGAVSMGVTLLPFEAPASA